MSNEKNVVSAANEDKTVMRSVDFSESEKVKKLEIYAKVWEERTGYYTKIRKRMRIGANRTGLLLLTTVLSSYMYSIYITRQESFLDDFEEPKRSAE